jgi:hypothetical protein
LAAKCEVINNEKECHNMRFLTDEEIIMQWKKNIADDSQRAILVAERDRIRGLRAKWDETLGKLDSHLIPALERDGRLAGKRTR